MVLPLGGKRLWRAATAVAKSAERQSPLPAKLPRIQETQLAVPSCESAAEPAAAVVAPTVPESPLVRDDEVWLTTTQAALIHLRAGAPHWYVACSFRQNSRKPIASASVIEFGSYAAAEMQGWNFCSDCLEEAGRLH